MTCYEDQSSSILILCKANSWSLLWMLLALQISVSDGAIIKLSSVSVSMSGGSNKTSCCLKRGDISAMGPLENWGETLWPDWRTEGIPLINSSAKSGSSSVNLIFPSVVSWGNIELWIDSILSGWTCCLGLRNWRGGFWSVEEGFFSNDSLLHLWSDGAWKCRIALLGLLVGLLPLCNPLFTAWRHICLKLWRIVLGF